MRWDHHKHKTYTQCPRHYKFDADRTEPTKPDNRYYAVRGIVMQKFFELYANGHYPKNQDMGFSQVKKFLKPFYDRELTYNHVDWRAPMCKKDKEGLLEEICEIIVQNLERLDLYASGVRSEVKYVVTLKNGDELVGKLDFEKDYPDGEVAILDGKSTATLNKNIDVEQLLFYAWLYRAKHGKLPGKLGFVYYQLVQLDWKTFDELDVIKAVRSVLASLEAARNDTIFAPKPCATACKYCPFMDKCPEGQASKDSRKRGSRDAGLEDLFGDASSDGVLPTPNKLPGSPEKKPRK